MKKLLFSIFVLLHISVFSQNVGIGTPTPLSKLNVRTTGFGIIHSSLGDSIQVGSYIDGTGGWLGTKSNHPLHFFTNNSLQLMTLSKSGLLGIGTTSPTAPLTFSNDAGSKISFNGANGSTDLGIGVSGSGDAELYTPTSSKSFNFGYGSSGNFTSGVKLISNGFVGVGLGALTPSGRVDMGSSDGNNLVLRNLSSLATSSENNMFFKMGNLWTGKISTIGTSTTDARMAFYTGSSSSPSGLAERLTIDSAGRVGIGINNPTAQLTIASNGIGLSQQSADALTKVGFYTAAGNAYVQTHSNHNLNFATNNGSSQMTLTTAGNLGIGTTNPGAMLDVNGTVKISGGTPGLNKVLTSDATGNASWREQAFTNSERFRFQVDGSTYGLGFFQLCLSTSLIYNKSTGITYTLSPNQIRISKSGLYYFECNFGIESSANFVLTGGITFDDTFNGTTYVERLKSNQIGTQVGIIFYNNMSFSTTRYVTAGTDVYFGLDFLYPNSPIYNIRRGIISGHLISE